MKSREKSARSHKHRSALGLVNTLPEEESLSSIPLVKLSCSHPSHRKKESNAFKVKSGIIKNQLSKLKVYGRIHGSSYQTFFTASEQKTQRLIKCCPCPQLVFIEHRQRKCFSCCWFSVSKTLFSNNPPFEKKSCFL